MIAVRLILTAALLGFVYCETGWATTVALALNTFAIETVVFAIRERKRLAP
jgi:hypothetical protein